MPAGTLKHGQGSTKEQQNADQKNPGLQVLGHARVARSEGKALTQVFGIEYARMAQEGPSPFVHAQVAVFGLTRIWPGHEWKGLQKWGNRRKTPFLIIKVRNNKLTHQQGVS